MKTFLVTLSLILSFSNVNAQFKGTIDVVDFYHSIGYQDNLREAKKTYDDVEGSAYMNDEFIPGTVVVDSMKSFKGIPLRYNIYTDQIEFQGKSDTPYYLDEPNRFSRIIIGDEYFIYSAYMDNGQTLNGYFKILKDGDTQLLEKYHIIYKPAEGAKALTDPQPAKFIRTPEERFLRTDSGVACRIKNGKDVIEFLADHSEELSKFVKENKLKTRKEEDLIRLIEFYDNL